MIRIFFFIWVFTVQALFLRAEIRGEFPAAKMEGRLDFPADETFLRSGGVQVFFELISREARAEERPSFKILRVLDTGDHWSKKNGPLYVLASRIVFQVEKDISFFSKERIYDESYLNRFLPAYQVRRLSERRFRSGALPRNDFEIEYFEPGSMPRSFGQLSESSGSPEVVLFQHNHEFEKIMGFKTALMGRTLTLHSPLGPGLTRITAWSLSYLHNIPPFFLGGEARVTGEAKKKSLELVARLRDFEDSWSLR